MPPYIQKRPEQLEFQAVQGVSAFGLDRVMFIHIYANFKEGL